MILAFIAQESGGDAAQFIVNIRQDSAQRHRVGSRQGRGKIVDQFRREARQENHSRSLHISGENVNGFAWANSPRRMPVALRPASEAIRTSPAAARNRMAGHSAPPIRCRIAPGNFSRSLNRYARRLIGSGARLIQLGARLLDFGRRLSRPSRRPEKFSELLWSDSPDSAALVIKPPLNS